MCMCMCMAAVAVQFVNPLRMPSQRLAQVPPARRAGRAAAPRAAAGTATRAATRAAAARAAHLHRRRRAQRRAPRCVWRRSVGGGRAPWRDNAVARRVLNLVLVLVRFAADANLRRHTLLGGL